MMAANSLIRQARPATVDLPFIPVLIRVPTLTPPTLRSAWHGSRRLAARPRRRLKREVRLACSAALLGLPMAWGVFALVGAGPGRAAQASAALAPAAPRFAELPAHPDPTAAWVTISLAPADAGPADAPAAPMAAPAGFLLPAEGIEEPFHAGD